MITLPTEGSHQVDKSFLLRAFVCTTGGALAYVIGGASAVLVVAGIFVLGILAEHACYYLGPAQGRWRR